MHPLDPRGASSPIVLTDNRNGCFTIRLQGHIATMSTRLATSELAVSALRTSCASDVHEQRRLSLRSLSRSPRSHSSSRIPASRFGLPGVPRLAPLPIIHNLPQLLYGRRDTSRRVLSSRDGASGHHTLVGPKASPHEFSPSPSSSPNGRPHPGLLRLPCEPPQVCQEVHN